MSVFVIDRPGLGVSSFWLTESEADYVAAAGFVMADCIGCLGAGADAEKEAAVD